MSPVNKGLPATLLLSIVLYGEEFKKPIAKHSRAAIGQKLPNANKMNKFDRNNIISENLRKAIGQVASPRQVSNQRIPAEPRGRTNSSFSLVLLFLPTPVKKKCISNTACMSFILGAFVGSVCDCFKLSWLSTFLKYLIQMIFVWGVFLYKNGEYFWHIFCTQVIPLVSTSIAWENCLPPMLSFMLSGKHITLKKNSPGSLKMPALNILKIFLNTSRIFAESISSIPKNHKYHLDTWKYLRNTNKILD